MSGIDFGKSRIVGATDHARHFGPIAGLENPGAVIASLAGAGEAAASPAG